MSAAFAVPTGTLRLDRYLVVAVDAARQGDPPGGRPPFSFLLPTRPIRCPWVDLVPAAPIVLYEVI
jgi:hypothetical protein